MTGRTIKRMAVVILAGVFTAGAGETPPPPSPNGSHGKDGTPMVLIPEGAFTMGAGDGSGNERPEHKVWLDSYLIDQFEVPINRYAKFLEQAKQSPPPTWDEDAVASAGNRPAVGLSWADAEAYCKWTGKRLPTEAEWEKAARGTDGRRYPWGQMQPFVDIANYNRGAWVSDAVTLTAIDSGIEGMSVRHGTKEGGRSPFGLYNMAGNAAEWVADWYDREYYAKSPERNPKGPVKGEKKVMRGGSWADLPMGLRVTARVSAEPDFQDRTLGVRCAMDATKP